MKNTDSCPEGTAPWPCGEFPSTIVIQRARVMSQPIARYGELSSMMTWAEAAAKKEKITREEADKWAFRSHQRAIAAQDAGKFAEEIVPVPVGKDKSGQINFFSIDEGPRRETTSGKTSQVKACLFRWCLYSRKLFPLKMTARQL